MTTRDRRGLVLPRAVVIAATALLLLLIAPLPAEAHSSLMSSDPADGAVLDHAPARATFRFDEPVTVARDGVQLVDAQGRLVPTTTSARGETLAVDLPDDLPRGTYAVLWRVVSLDGDPVGGSLSFSVGAPSPEFTMPSVPGSPGSVHALRAVTQALQYVGLFVAAGLAVFATWIATARPLPRRSALRRTTWGAALLAYLGAVFTVPLTVIVQRAGDLGELTSVDTWFGGERGVYPGVLAVAVGLGFAVVATAALRSLPLRLLRTMAALAVLAPAVGLALTGHPRAARPEPLVMAVDVLHVVAGSLWLGGLVGLVLVLPRSSTDHRARTLTRFSTFAIGSLALLLLTGSLLAWRIAGTWDLLDTTYGRLLLTKIDLVLVALAFAAVNRQLVRSHDTTRVGREVRVEAALLVVVLALTAVLVNQSPRSRVDQRSGQPMALSSAALGARYKVLVELTPGEVGRTRLVLRLQDRQGAPVEPGSAPTLALRSVGADLGDIPLAESGVGTWSAEVVVPSPGAWTAQVSLRLKHSDTRVAQAPLTVLPAE